MIVKDFHFTIKKHQLKDDQLCILVGHDGSVTAGYWINSFASEDPKDPEGFFVKIAHDIPELREIWAWQLLDAENAPQKVRKKAKASEPEIELVFEDFHELTPDSEPADGTECLLLRKDGKPDAGVWDALDPLTAPGGVRGFFYKSTRAICCEDVAGWLDLTAYRVDCEYTRKIRAEKAASPAPEPEEEKPEPPNRFKYGYGIDAYYDRALKKLKKDYPTAKREHMFPNGDFYTIKKLGDRHELIHYSTNYNGSKNRIEKGEIKTAEDLISRIYYDSLQTVKNANYAVKFKYGMDIGAYTEKALQIVAEKYPWARRELLEEKLYYTIEKRGEYDQFILHRRNEDGTEYFSAREYCESSEDFINSVVEDYTEILMEANEVVEKYDVPHGSASAGFGGCWNLEQYTVSRLKSGDFKVYVQAGDRVSGAGRDFFIPATLCRAKSYDEFLDAYTEIVPGGAFGLYKEDLIGDEKLKVLFGF